MSAAVTRFALLILAIVLIVAGLIVLPLPIPFGAIMIVTGLGILISTSESAAEWVRRRRMKSARLDSWLAAAEMRLPGKLGEILRRTAP
ncbi:MAG: PGPGW domain-containing protein [Rhodomicrobiaceae bacterium]